MGNVPQVVGVEDGRHEAAHGERGVQHGQAEPARQGVIGADDHQGAHEDEHENIPEGHVLVGDGAARVEPAAEKADDAEKEEGPAADGDQQKTQRESHGEQQDARRQELPRGQEPLGEDPARAVGLVAVHPLDVVEVVAHHVRPDVEQQ